MYTKSFIPTLNTFFDDFITKDVVNLGHEITKGFVNQSPAVNIIENDKHYYFKIAAPGLTKSNFNVELNKNILTISSSNNEKDRPVYLKEEFDYSNFKRSFTLPENKINSEKTSAEYKNGVLTISIAKLAKEEQKLSKLIEIK